MLIGLTHTDCPNAKSVGEIIRELGYLDEENAPSIMTINPMNKTSVIDSLMMMKSLILREVEAT